MNYEDFSPEAQKVINDFRGLIENIKSGKDKAKIYYWGRKNNCPSIVERTAGQSDYTPAVSFISAYCLVARIPNNKYWEIISFLRDRDYFLPKFSSEEDYQQNKHKYPFIEE